MKKIFFLLILFALVNNLQAQTPLPNKPLAAPKNMALKSGDSVIQFVPVTVGPFCPNELMGGDREFDGHGPEVWAWIRLKIVQKKYIDAEVYMHARETVSDWSETEGTWTKRLYTAPTGYEIIEIQTGKASEVHYVSKPGVSSFSPTGWYRQSAVQEEHNVPFKDDGLVTRWNILGDTGGSDISDDTNCNDDTQVAVQLNPVKLKLRAFSRKF